MRSLWLVLALAVALVALVNAETPEEMVEYCPGNNIITQDEHGDEEEFNAEDIGYPADIMYDITLSLAPVKTKASAIRLHKPDSAVYVCVSCSDAGGLAQLKKSWDDLKEALSTPGNTVAWNTKFDYSRTGMYMFVSEEDMQKTESMCGGAAAELEDNFMGHVDMRKYRETAIGERDAEEADAATSETALATTGKVAYLMLGGKAAGVETFDYVSKFVLGLANIKKGLETNYGFRTYVFFPATYATHKDYAKLRKTGEWNSLVTGGIEYDSPANLIAAVESESAKNKDADAYFHFIGHGEPDHLFTPGGDIYYAAEGRDFFNKISARNAVFTIDACHSAHAFSSELNEYWNPENHPAPHIGALFGVSTAAPAQEAGAEATMFLGNIFNLEKPSDKITQTTTSTQLEGMMYNDADRGVLGLHIWHLKDTATVRIGQVFTDAEAEEENGDGQGEPLEADDVAGPMEPVVSGAEPVGKAEPVVVADVQAEKEEVAADGEKLSADKEEVVAETDKLEADQAELQVKESALLRGNGDR